MKQKYEIEAGLVTRLDEEFIYVWWKKQHLDELIFNRCYNPEITCGDIVTFEISHPSTEVQEAKLTKLPNHCFTIHISGKDQSTCWIRTNIILPPKGSTYFAEQEKYCQKEGKRLQFMAFSKEFGAVACCFPVDHKPDTVYSCLIGRMPTKFDAKIKTKLDTLFFVTTHGIKENTDAEEIAKLRQCAPWNQEEFSERSPANIWVKDQVQPEEADEKSQGSDASISSPVISDSKPLFEFSNEEVAAVPKENNEKYPIVPVFPQLVPASPSSVPIFMPKPPSIASMVSANFQPKVIQWVEGEDDLDTMSVDCLTKCLGLKLPERADPICDGESNKKPQTVLGESASFSDLSKLTQNTMKTEEESSHGKNFDSVWDIYKKLRGKGLFLEAATLKKRSLDLYMEYEILLAKYNV